MCPGAGEIFPPPSGDERDDQKGANGIKLDDHVLHLHDEHGGGDGVKLHGP